jgi:hypothetical protein
MVKEAIRENPGLTIKEIAEICRNKHHYASSATFRSCIPKYVMSGVIDGIVIDDSRKPYRYYIEEAKC